MYTLVESGTKKHPINQVLVTGKGSDLNNTIALQGRAKRKFITQSIVLGLIDIAKTKGDTINEKAFWNTYYCQSSITTANGKLYGNYCKNRFCTLCCSIRKAEIINRYYPIIKEWQEPYFVTLTVKSCKAKNLNATLRVMKVAFKKIIDKYKKRDQRGTGTKLIGVKSIECNFNPAKKWYNPHFHLIVANKEIGEILVNEWLSRSKKHHTNRKGQDIRKVFDIEKNLIEIIKYGSKIFTEPDVRKSSKDQSNHQIYIAALYTILDAMKGKRIFDRFGFDIPKTNKTQLSNTKILSNYENWEFVPEIADWQNTTTLQTLTDYKPPSYLQAMLINNVNSSLL